MAKSLKVAKEHETRARIVASATREIDEVGILGLRMARIAKNAGVTIPLISKYFGGRDGLLAVALGDWYENFVTQFRARIDMWIDSSEKLKLEEFAILAPKPKQNEYRKIREFRLQVLAVAIENEELGERIRKITSDAYEWTNDAIRRGREKLPADDSNFDERIFSLLLFNVMYVFTDLVSTEAINDVEYSRFIVDLVRASSLYRGKQN